MPNAHISDGHITKQLWALPWLCTMLIWQLHIQQEGLDPFCALSGRTHQLRSSTAFVCDNKCEVSVLLVQDCNFNSRTHAFEARQV
jgi:hypothetical protein